MSDLPITKNDYDRAVVLANVLSEFKSICEMREDISDVHFTPQANGYDISFRQNGTDTKLFITFKNRYTDSLTIKRFDGESLTASFALKKTDSLSGLLEAVLHPCPSKKRADRQGSFFCLRLSLLLRFMRLLPLFPSSATPTLTKHDRQTPPSFWAPERQTARCPPFSVNELTTLLIFMKAAP